MNQFEAGDIVVYRSKPGSSEIGYVEYKAIVLEQEEGKVTFVGEIIEVIYMPFADRDERKVGARFTTMNSDNFVLDEQQILRTFHIALDRLSKKL